MSREKRHLVVRAFDADLHGPNAAGVQERDVEVDFVSENLEPVREHATGNGEMTCFVALGKQLRDDRLNNTDAGAIAGIGG